jgi:hypothetical protein
MTLGLVPFHVLPCTFPGLEAWETIIVVQELQREALETTIAVQGLQPEALGKIVAAQEHRLV